MTPEHLKLLEESAALLYTDEELAIILGVTEAEFRVLMDDKEGDVYRTVARGRLLTDAQHRQAVIELGQRGSSPAQAMVDRWLNRIGL